MSSDEQPTRFDRDRHGYGENFRELRRRVLATNTECESCAPSSPGVSGLREDSNQ